MTTRPEDYQRRQEELAGWKVGIVSYRLGDRYHCEVDNVSPGARLSRGEGATREEAEKQALDQARVMLARTRIYPAD
jgi:dsRNA-specific ribonuclease